MGVADVMETDGADALSYGAVYGHQPLREWVCHKLKVFEDLDVSPDNILITNGSGDAIGLIIQTFIDEGDVDMLKALAVLQRNGYDGVLIPDHTPQMSCSAPWHAGMAYALGYMQAALRTLRG